MGINGDEVTGSALDQLRADASRFDDASLVHLANKGLVRRGQKLAQDSLAITETADGCSIASSGWTLQFTTGRPLQDGSCDCSTAGVCQHIIAGIISLRSAPASAEADGGDAAGGVAAAGEAAESQEGPGAEPIRHALLSLSDADFLAWTKTADARWAASRIEALDVDQVVITMDRYVGIDLPAPHPNVLFMGEALGQAIVKPSGRHDRRSVALAVLAVWQAEGRTYVAPASTTTRPINELVDERLTVLARVRRLTEDLLTMGLLYLADSEAERIGSLTASLRGVKLYRLAVLAERCADQIDAIAELSSDADSERLLEQLAEMSVVADATAARLEAGTAAPEGLVGSARAQYENVGQLNVLGVGNYDWGDNRFAGTTTVVAESSTRIYAVSAPRIVNGRRLANVQQWSGIGSIAEATGSLLQLSNAQATAALRLSSSQKTVATIGRDLTTEDLASLAWGGTAPSHGSRLFGSPSTTWMVLAVQAERSAVAFDAVQQELVWEIRSAGADVSARIPYQQHSRIAIESLERLVATRTPQFVVGRLRVSTDGLLLWPVSLMLDGNFHNLSSPAKDNRTPFFNRKATVEEADEPVASVTQFERLWAELVRLAEGGSRAATAESLQRLSRSAEEAGLTVLSTTVDKSQSPSEAILRATWLKLLVQDLG